MLSSFTTRLVGLIGGIIVLTICIGLSIILGYTDTNVRAVIDTFQHFSGSNTQLVIKNVRLPRALIGASVGGCLAVAGALMQALTKNPLASPDIMGVNAGAGLFIVVAVIFFSVSSLHSFTWIAFLGAAIASFIVYCLGSLGKDGLTPMKMTLAGAAIAAMFGSLTQGLLVINESSLDQVLFWLAGSVQGRKLEILFAVLPYMIFALACSFLLGKQINILVMGEKLAKGLGQRTGMVKLLMSLMVVLLAGGAVAVAGPISFVGVMIPHVARWLVGNDHRWVLPYCSVLGGIFLIIADIGARYILMPEEVPVGVLTAFIGVPFFIYIARKKGEAL
ncbi:FecCD family ABC transporter permease [Bacillus smithii]|uniref:FecCD family ABC transporter permease n=1 Tax=Bacillus smithii TaxID=1479 RepID=UPI0022E0EAB1|nr:iron ABC transporter permease [Bacillus smithii]MED0660162.1 iron ABC transporter permease [Bacillus smithii]